ncbi:MAG: Uma2 family endonuclease [Firmicutes bacterium]|nr:Uma2 family endonuclease [Bacillota bacterium]
MGIKHLDPNELERWERIDGIIYDMSPAPSSGHQRLSRQLTIAIGSYLNGQPCELFYAPFDVYLTADDQGDYVQPDVAVICDPSMIRDNGCYGPPDWVLEILSPSTGVKDKTTKLRAYKFAGVREYWIIDPVHQFVEVHDLKNNVFPTVYGKDETVTVGIFRDLQINLQDIFD